VPSDASSSVGIQTGTTKYVIPWLDAPVDPESLSRSDARVGAGAK